MLAVRAALGSILVLAAATAGCADDGPPFTIAVVGYQSVLIDDALPTTVTIRFDGAPVFPVRVTYRTSVEASDVLDHFAYDASVQKAVTAERADVGDGHQVTVEALTCHTPESGAAAASFLVWVTMIDQRGDRSNEVELALTCRIP